MKPISCDVLVIGGGVSGVAAALAAVREGATTVLVEKESYLGGIGYAGMLRHICGLYLNAEAAPTETLNKGLTREIVTSLMHVGSGNKILKMGQVYVLDYSSKELHSVLSTFCAAETKLKVLCESAAVSVETSQGRVDRVLIEQKSDKQAVVPKMLIDCTGDGNISAMAGAAFELSFLDIRQMAGLTIRLTGLKNTDDALSIKVPYFCSQAVQQGRFVSAVRFTTFMHGDAADEGYLKMSIDAADDPDREGKAKKDADALVQYLASVLPAFQTVSIAAVSHKVLDREGRRICGDYTLTEQDVLSARKFHDGVVKNAWPIELWDRSRGTVYQYVPRGDYYEIPFRCLTVKGFSNLLAAGRCISVTHEALGSTRVIGICIALGEQAGKAAAYHVKHGKYPENMKEY
jgi:hypothetical protein